MADAIGSESSSLDVNNDRDSPSLLGEPRKKQRLRKLMHSANQNLKGSREWILLDVQKKKMQNHLRTVEDLSLKVEQVT
jgi:hypothetical protein